jgi:hypothetical protein
MFTGSAAPRAVGNVYDIAVTFGPAPCDLVGMTLRGVGLYDAPLRQLLAVGLNEGRNQGFLFLGNRPAVASAGVDLKAAPRAAAGPRFRATVAGEPLVVFGQR